MGTGTKRISSEHIKGVKASFKVADEHLSDKSSDLIESDATEKLSAATSSIKQMITDLSDTVENLDQYLNSIADAFDRVDGDLAEAIKNNISESFSKVSYCIWENLLFIADFILMRKSFINWENQI